MLSLFAVTEDEIVEGIAQNDRRKDRCLAFIRHINNINLQHPKAWRFIDMTADKQLDTEAQQLMTSLREETIPQLLPAENIFRFETDWSDDDGINERDHAAYLQQFCDTFETAIKQQIGWYLFTIPNKKYVHDVHSNCDVLSKISWLNMTTCKSNTP